MRAIGGLFCINGAGDVPLRLGAPDLRITYGENRGEALLFDVILPVTGPDNTRRIADEDAAQQMEGMPLLHLKSHQNGNLHPGWVEWFEKFGHRTKGPSRGVQYQNARLAIAAMRENVGFFIGGLSLFLDDVKNGAAVLRFPVSEHLKSPHPYRLQIRPDAANRPQIERFVTWLRAEAKEAQREIDRLIGR